MLGHWMSTEEYQEHVVTLLRPYHNELCRKVLRYRKIIQKLWLLDLDKAKSIMQPLYAPDTGRPAKHQSQLLRALVAMIHFKETSITQWIQTLYEDDILAILCGFYPGQIPSVGAVYDFQSRFWKDSSPTKRVLRRGRKKGRKPQNKSEKMKPKHPGVVQRLAQRVRAGQVTSLGVDEILNKIMAECAVKPSARLGLLGENYAIAADGAPLITGAHPWGHRQCPCRKHGIQRCDCPKVFTDPTATWGWDSYHEQWFFGHTLYGITSADSPNDLPIYLTLNQASRHDSVSFVVALQRMHHLYPDMQHGRVLLDAAHDSYAIYDLVDSFGMEPFIDLNGRQHSRRYQGPLDLTAEGVPICPAQLPMKNWGYQNDRCRIKWRCPCHQNLEQCPLGKPCSPSPYGRVVYTKKDDDVRLFGAVARSSKTWKAIYKRRTTVERSFKRILVDYAIEAGKVRDKRYWSWRVILAGINIHLDAQRQVQVCPWLEDILAQAPAA